MILNYYKLRGSPQSVLTSAAALNQALRAAALNRVDLLSEDNEARVNQRDENDLFLILTYNPANPDVKGTLQRYWPPPSLIVLKT